MKIIFLFWGSNLFICLFKKWYFWDKLDSLLPGAPKIKLSTLLPLFIFLPHVNEIYRGRKGTY